ncbi:MAG: alkaline phosphatase, partial [Candidatus Entotheonellia bacterium]
DQYLALEPDVILGGGSDYFLPIGTRGGRRNDGKDLIAAFQARGYQVARNVQELRAATGPRLLGLFAEQDMRHEIDRDSSREPSIAEMAQAAIRMLSTGSPHGFVLLLETENTDTAGHRHDIAALIGDLWAFDRAVQLALQFQRRTFPETLLLVTGDHETGGLELTDALKNLRNTSSRDGFSRDPVQWEMLHRLIRSVEKGATPGRRLTAEALEKLMAERFPGFHLDADLRRAFLKQPLLARDVSHPLPSTLALGTSRQLAFSWSTSGHSAQPVRIGAVGSGANLFQGLLDNTDFGKILHRLIEGQPAD